MVRNNQLILLCFFLLSSIGSSSDGMAQDGTRSDGAYQLAITEIGSHQNPTWSPQQHKILYTQWKGGYNTGPSDLVIFSFSDNSNRTLVSDDSDNVNLPGSSWNPTTGKIVFSSSREPHDEIYEIAAEDQPGGEVKLTERDQIMAFEPSFSPDGQWVVFESHPLDVEDNGVITKFRTDGTSDYIALTDPKGDARQPNWSPVEEKILYQKLEGGQWDLWVVGSDGISRNKVTNGPGDKTDASFSPDGQWIVYSGESENTEFADLFVIPVDGGETIRVSNFPQGTDGAPSWSPNGKLIAFESAAGEPGGSNGTTLWIIAAPQDIVDTFNFKTGLWWNPAESGWGVTLNQQGNIIFATIFTYDTNGLPIWYVASNCSMSGESCTGELYKVLGGSSILDTWDGKDKLVQVVGSVVFTFTDDDTATMAFTLNGVEGSKDITRQVFGTLSPGTPMTALWWNPNESGWGVTLTRQTGTAFAALFTYNSNGFPTWYVASDCIVLDLSCTGELYEVTGGSAIEEVWTGANKMVNSVGNISFQFTDDDHGSITFDINDADGSKVISRQVFN